MTGPPSRIWAVLAAAGRGRRMGSTLPKQYLPLHGITVIEHSLSRLLALPEIRQVLVALPPDDRHFSRLPIAQDSRVRTVPGGDTRCQSVLNALLRLDANGADRGAYKGTDKVADEAADDDWVLVHDAVRPCVRTSDVQRLLNELRDDPVGGLLGAPVEHTLKEVTAAGNGAGSTASARVSATVDRRPIHYAFTPQMFRYALLREALEKALTRATPPTDESAAVEAAGHHPRIVPGTPDNLKITHQSDLPLATAILKHQEAEG